MSKKVDALLEYKARLEKLSACWSPHKGQKKVLRAMFNDGCKRAFVQAGRKFGKSELCMYAAWRTAVLNDNAQVYIVGPTRKDQGEIMWATHRLQGFGPQFGQEVLDSQFRIRFPWNSFIKIDGSENYESFRGTQYDLMIIDEFKDVDPRFYEAAYPNLLAKNGTLMIIGTPPDRENHYVQLANEAKGDPDWTFFHATSWDNDKLPGGKEWLEKEKRKYYARGDEKIWRREYEAEFVPGGATAVFPMFTREQHVRPFDVLEAELKAHRGGLRWFTVSDPGTTTVFAVLFIAYNPHTSQVYVLDEIYEKDRSECSAIKIWKRVLEKKKKLAPRLEPEKWTDVFDEAAAWFSNEVANHFGHGLIPTNKRVANKENQISLIRDALSRENGFVISEDCLKAIWEIANYVTDEEGSYIKRDDHCIDGLRYFFDASGYTFDVVAEEKDDDTHRAYTPDDDLMTYQKQKDPFFCVLYDW